MISISLCMIVKNEERVLARCLDSIHDLMDEIIIVDTGSTDATKEIAAHYTDRIYDFTWVDDFSAARNFAMEKASGDYIYCADADEVLDAENHEKFRILKQAMLPEIEIVQMYYGNQLSHGTVYNYDRELRPKLFKRLRSFVYEDPIHEMVRLTPIVFDSDIEITHMPEESHAGRDLAAFRRIAGKEMSMRLFSMYARELFVAGEKEDFLQALPFFKEMADGGMLSEEHLQEALCVLVRGMRLNGDFLMMYHYALKAIAGGGESEVCYELGEYYREAGLLEEAVIWYENAMQGTQSILDIRCQEHFPQQGLMMCQKALSNTELVQKNV